MRSLGKGLGFSTGVNIGSFNLQSGQLPTPEPTRYGLVVLSGVLLIASQGFKQLETEPHATSFL